MIYKEKFKKEINITRQNYLEKICDSNFYLYNNGLLSYLITTKYNLIKYFITKQNIYLKQNTITNLIVEEQSLMFNFTK